MSSTLQLRNVVVNGHRTSMRLEPAMWNALEEIATREDRSLNQIVSLLDFKRAESSLTAAVRVFCVEYFRGDPARRADLLTPEDDGFAETAAPYDAGLGDLDRALAAVGSA